MNDRTRALFEDLLTKSRAASPSRSGGAGGSTSADNPLGLRFAAGARVRDLATGARGVIVSATRWAVNNQELYGVTLEDARLVTRGRDELEPDQTPAPPAGT